MIISNNFTLLIFISTFLAMILNVLLSSYLFMRSKSKSKNKKDFIKNLIFFTILPELLVLLTSIYLIFKVVSMYLSKI